MMLKDAMVSMFQLCMTMIIISIISAVKATILLL